MRSIEKLQKLLEMLEREYPDYIQNKNETDIAYMEGCIEGVKQSITLLKEK